MEKKELEERISKLQKEVENKRKKREYKVMAGFAVAYFVILCFFEHSPEDFNEFFKYCFSSVILSVIHFVINQTVFEHLFQRNEIEESELKELQKQLFAIQEKEIDERIKKYTKR